MKVRSDAEPRLGKVLEFMQLLWSVDHALQARSKRMRRRLGLTGPQRLAVRIVGRFPGISAKDIARTLRVDPSTLTGVLQRLEKRALIQRRVDPADARRALFQLTPRGRRLDRARARTVESAVRGAIGNLDDRMLEAARRVLRALEAELARDDEAG